MADFTLGINLADIAPPYDEVSRILRSVAEAIDAGNADLTQFKFQTIRDNAGKRIGSYRLEAPETDRYRCKGCGRTESVHPFDSCDGGPEGWEAIK